MKNSETGNKEIEYFQIPIILPKEKIILSIFYGKTVVMYW